MVSIILITRDEIKLLKHCSAIQMALGRFCPVGFCLGVCVCGGGGGGGGWGGGGGGGVRVISAITNESDFV